jgi:hypothetical protein
LVAAVARKQKRLEYMNRGVGVHPVLQEERYIVVVVPALNTTPET